VQNTSNICAIRTILWGNIEMNLKELRLEKKLTQKEVAELVGISLRSYKYYENDIDKVGTLKYNYIIDKLKEINPIDESHGVLELEDIRRICSDIFDKYDVEFCYLFGSYAKSKATPVSDVDMLVSANVNGLAFFGMVEELRTKLHKNVDVLDINQLNNNIELAKEILKEGIKIYG
jgi:hypothetical protein